MRTDVRARAVRARVAAWCFSRVPTRALWSLVVTASCAVLRVNEFNFNAFSFLTATVTHARNRHVAAMLRALLVMSIAATAALRLVCPPRMLELPDSFPQRDRLNIDGRRAVVVVYSEDQSTRAKQVLQQFQDAAEDYSERGCALVAVRSRTLDGIERKYPSFRFVSGLESLEELRGALGLAESLQPVQWGAQAYLLDPDGVVRAASDDVRASTVWGALTRTLHEITWAPGDGEEEAKLSFWEDEKRRQAAWSENADWAATLAADESLRQPTRGWFDGLFDKPDSRYYLAESEQPLLAAEGANEPADAASARIAKEAPDWYREKMRRLDAKASSEDVSAMPSSFFELWTQQSERIANAAALDAAATTPSLPGGTEAAVDPAALDKEIGALDKEIGALEAAKVSAVAQQEFLQAGELLEKISRLKEQRAALEGNAQPATGAEGGGASPPPPPDAPGAPEVAALANVAMALERASMLAVALSRSGVTAESKRRVRLLRELEATVRELESEGFDDTAVLGPLRDQVKAGWANAPPDARAKAAAEAAAGEEKPLTAEDVRDLLGDALKRVDLDLRKWRLRIKDE